MTSVNMNEFPLKHDIHVEWETPRHAEIAKQVLQVDKELHVNKARTEFDVQQNTLITSVYAIDWRVLRIKTNAIYDNLILIAELIENFDTDKLDQYFKKE